MPKWDSDQYLKFQRERTQPAIDLCRRINHESPQNIIDIGCGPGNSTAVLYGRFEKSRIVGVDSSEEMLQKARADYPQLEFSLFDAAEEKCYSKGGYDVVFSNACIQWVPDHAVLLGRMMGLLNDGGELAVQIPMNFNEPIHKIIEKITASSEWRKKFEDPRIFYTLSAGEYFDILSEISSDFQMWETTYFHKMRSCDDIIEWYKGTGLRPYLQALDVEGGERFLSQIRKELEKAYPKQRNGEIIFRFPRLFFIAKR